MARVLLDMAISLVPSLLGDGVPLFERPGTGWRLTKARVVDAPGVTHLRYRVDTPEG